MDYDLIYNVINLRKGFDYLLNALILSEDMDGLDELAFILMKFSEQKIKELEEKEKWI